MDKLKENPFLFGVAGAGILLLILAGVLIVPAWSSVGKLRESVRIDQGKLSSATKDTPGEPDILSYNDNVVAKELKDEKDYYGKLSASYHKVAEFYAKYDFNLEWWMTTNEEQPNLAKLDAADMKKLIERLPTLRKEPSLGALKVSLIDAAGTLENMLKSKGVKIGLFDEPKPDQYTHGFNWETNEIKWSDIENNKEEVSAVLKTLQKRYWIRARMANICAKTDVRVLRLGDVYFFRPLSTKFRGIMPWDQRPSDSPEQNVYDFFYPSAEESGHSQVFKVQREKFQDFDLPGGLGKTISFGVTVDLLYSEVPKFIRKMIDLVDPTVQPKLLVNVVGSRLMSLQQNKLKDTFDWKETDNAATSEANKNAAEAEFYKAGKPVPVRLHLTCQVFDFDASKLPDWAKARLPDWAKTE